MANKKAPPAKKKVPVKGKVSKVKNSGTKVEAPIDNPKKSKHSKSSVVNARHVKIDRVDNGYIIEASDFVSNEKHIASTAKEVMSKLKHFLGLK